MGEFELLAKLRERLPSAGPRVRLGSGDDAAVTVPGGATATSVDAIVDGVHFRREQTEPEEIGHKALATALSDLAAMGAEPGEAYVYLGLPPEVGEEEALRLLDGLAALAAETGTTLAGGDLTRAPALTLAVTVVGHAAAPEQLLARSGAAAGEVAVVTGELGGAAAGLLLLDRPALAGELPAAAAASLRRRQLRPQPRLAAGRALVAAGATAMIDVSDGLGADAGHLSAASDVGLLIDAALLPLADGVVALAAAAGRDPWALAAGGGEDYELLATIPASRLPNARAALAAQGLALTAIGEVHSRAGAGVEIRLPDGARLDASGYDQLG